MNERFRDPRGTWMSFLDEEILVRCPDCQGCAVVTVHPRYDTQTAEPSYLGAFAPRRLVCSACLLAREWPGKTIIRHTDARDPYFGLPLWLQTRCGGNLLWAYGHRHLDLLEDYVTARHRERGARPGSMSMVERLPTWLKSARNRSEVLKAIRRIRRGAPPSRHRPESSPTRAD
ncbi:hypothetical protein ACOZ38_26795 [Sphaerisporangium viridialbum]|uniref:hypothetical protein n=1 Tax=Sphaerisporangium viridialbum TaxID=46189 RepID=UPI003C73D673